MFWLHINMEKQIAKMILQIQLQLNNFFKCYPFTKK
jgi:hypothetical protein